MRAIVLDLLALSRCRHITSSDEALSGEVFISSCWNAIERLYVEIISVRGKTYSDSNSDRYVIYVSKTAFDRFKESLLKLLYGSDDKYEQSLLRDIAQKIYSFYSKKLLEPFTHQGTCDLSGYHADEYCDLREALSKTINECNLYCAIVCVDKTFSYDDLVKLYYEQRDKEERDEVEIQETELARTKHNTRILMLAKSRS